MDRNNDFVRKTYYSQELKHQICKDHVNNGLSLRECVDKYQLSCHSLVHDWLRKLGYVAGYDRRTRTAYLGVENFSPMPKKSKESSPISDEQEQINLLKRELENTRILAEGYKRMIEIAETELKISIRKKPNTK
jgi:transposase-like protein